MPSQRAWREAPSAAWGVPAKGGSSGTASGRHAAGRTQSPPIGASDLPSDALRRQIVNLYLADVYLDDKAHPAVIAPDQPQKKVSSGLTMERSCRSMALVRIDERYASERADVRNSTGK